MKRWLAIVAVVTVWSTVSAFASGNSHGGGSSAAPAAHHSSSGSAPAARTTAGPHLSSVPHYYSSRPMPYRPVTTTHNGNRTLNYPAVGVSTVQRSAHSNGANSNNARMLQHNTGNLQRSNAANLQSTGRNLQRSGGNAQHAGAINLIGKHRLDPQSSARLRNWGGNVSSTAQAHQNHLNNCHNHHNHNWWHNHCAAFIFWDWGWWGWWDGWWYPAWGYDAYSYYGYNEPIYGEGDFSPEQIIASVQVALQQRGYYQYAIDGRMGPQTRSAIARYQRDNRMSITSEVDPATLGSLGIIR